MKPGDKVHYIDTYNITNAVFECVHFGIVKDVRENGIFVVFNCSGKWDKYWLYTGQLCSKDMVHPGWEAVFTGVDTFNNARKVERHIHYTGTRKEYHNIHGPSMTVFNSDGSVHSESYHIDGVELDEAKWERVSLNRLADGIGLGDLFGEQGDW